MVINLNQKIMSNVIEIMQKACQEKRETIQKNFEKANTGEGSRGGKIIGHTKSGKPVYEDKGGDHKAYENFSSQDHRDAMDYHWKLSDKYFREKKKLEKKGEGIKDKSWNEASEKESHHFKVYHEHGKLKNEKALQEKSSKSKK